MPGLGPSFRPGGYGPSVNLKWPFWAKADPVSSFSSTLKMEGLIEDFSAGAVDTVKWPSRVGFTQTGGLGVLAAPGAAGGESNLKSAYIWDIRESSISWQWTFPTLGGNWVARVRIYITNNEFNNYFNYEVNNSTGFTTTREQVSGIGVRNSSSTAIDLVNHRWGRIRYEGNTVYFDASPDGVNWTTINSGTTLIDLERASNQAAFHHSWPTATAPGPTDDLSVDNINIAGVPGSGQNIAVGVATETSTAAAISSSKSMLMDFASETDTATVITAARPIPVGLATETDTATAIASSKASAMGVATETDTAQGVSSKKTVLTGQATETDTAQGISFTKSAAVGQASETDTATAMSSVKALIVNQATETDTATGLVAPKLIAVGVVTETDTATAIASLKSLLVGQVTETDTALSISTQKSLAMNLATETDTAAAIALVVKQKLIGAALETDSALPISPPAAPQTAPLLGLMRVGR
jgi:hypothetical protein